MILICIALSDSILFIFIPLFWESVNPSFPRMSRPSRLTVFEFTTRISLLAASHCPELSFSWIAPAIGISMLLKHLYLVWHSFGSFHLAVLHCWSILFASSLPMKLLGLPVSASQSISVPSEVVFNQISSVSVGENLLGWALLNVFCLIKLTVFKLLNTSFIKVLKVYVFVIVIRLGILVLRWVLLVERRCSYIAYPSGLRDVFLDYSLLGSYL